MTLDLDDMTARLHCFFKLKNARLFRLRAFKALIGARVSARHDSFTWLLAFLILMTCRVIDSLIVWMAH